MRLLFVFVIFLAMVQTPKEIQATTVSKNVSLHCNGYSENKDSGRRNPNSQNFIVSESGSWFRFRGMRIKRNDILKNPSSQAPEIWQYVVPKKGDFGEVTIRLNFKTLYLSLVGDDVTYIMACIPFAAPFSK